MDLRSTSGILGGSWMRIMIKWSAWWTVRTKYIVPPLPREWGVRRMTAAEMVASRLLASTILLLVQWS